MKHITSSRNTECFADAVALGNFDGLHRGHQELIRVTKESGNAAVFSFFPPPLSVLGCTPVKTIMTSREKAFLLEKMGIDLFIEYPFDNQISNMPPESFVRDVLVGQLRCRTVIIGEDYRFGQQGGGNCEMLCKLGQALKFEVKVIPHIMDSGSKISSTRVREAIAKKEFETAARLMGRPYFVMGEVIRGNMLGHGMGIPTANLAPSIYKFLPPSGVYHSFIKLDDENFLGLTNIGTRPTVADDKEIMIETHILEFDGNIYGQTITVEFGRWIRSESKFESLDALRAQITSDIATVKTIHHQTQNFETLD